MNAISRLLKKIISGGQTGVDKAALDAAISLDFDYGGYCPKGRFNELGEIPLQYSKLIEVEGFFKTQQDNYDTRTRQNIIHSDGTLILLPSIEAFSRIQDGTRLTQQAVIEQNKPFLCIDLTATEESNLSKCLAWIEENNIEILNVAGPRESSHPTIGQQSFHLLHALLSHYNQVPTYEAY